MQDVVQLREIARLTAEGVSLEGIRRMLDLENQVSPLASACENSSPRSPTKLLQRPGRRVFPRQAPRATSSRSEAGTRAKKSNSVVVWRPFGPRD